MSRAADEIRRGLKEAIAFAEGNADARQYQVHIPEHANPASLKRIMDAAGSEAERNGLTPEILQSILRDR